MAIIARAHNEDVHVYVDRCTRKMDWRNFRHKMKMRMLLIVEAIFYGLKWVFPKAYYTFQAKRLRMDMKYWLTIAAEITELMELMREERESQWGCERDYK